MDQANASSQTEWQKPCNAAVQYSPRSMSNEEAQRIWQDESMNEFLNRITPRYHMYNM